MGVCCVPEHIRPQLVNSYANVTWSSVVVSLPHDSCCFAVVIVRGLVVCVRCMGFRCTRICLTADGEPVFHFTWNGVVISSPRALTRSPLPSGSVATTRSMPTGFTEVAPFTMARKVSYRAPRIAASSPSRMRMDGQVSAETNVFSGYYFSSKKAAGGCVVFNSATLFLRFTEQAYMRDNWGHPIGKPKRLPRLDVHQVGR